MLLSHKFSIHHAHTNSSHETILLSIINIKIDLSCNRLRGKTLNLVYVIFSSQTLALEENAPIKEKPDLMYLLHLFINFSLSLFFWLCK